MASSDITNILSVLLVIGLAFRSMALYAEASKKEVIDVAEVTSVTTTVADLAVKALAEGGDADAQCQMGLFYMNGLGVEQDDDKAVEWLEKAAAQNHAQAQYNLGIYYARFSDKESQRLAVKWLGEAAKQDYADAEYNLAKLYLNSHHPASKEQGAGRRAIQLLRLAAVQGHAGAKEMLKELGVDISTSQENLEELKQAERATFINNA